MHCLYWVPKVFPDRLESLDMNSNMIVTFCLIAGAFFYIIFFSPSRDEVSRVPSPSGD